MDSTDLGQLVGVYSIPLPASVIDELEMGTSSSDADRDRADSDEQSSLSQQSPNRGSERSISSNQSTRSKQQSNRRADGPHSTSAEVRSTLSTPYSTEVTESGSQIQSNGSMVRPSFIGDANNELLPSITERILARDISLSPLVLCGPSGVGKTTLARSLAEYATQFAQSKPDAHSEMDQIRLSEGTSESSSELNWMEMSCADFARLVAQAYETNTIDHFREKFSQLRGLFLDNLQELEHKASAQHELRLLLDRFESQRRWMVITSNKYPNQFERMEPTLSSRLMLGLCVALNPPGPLARRQIIPKEIDRLQLRLDPDAVEYLIEHTQGTVPQLVETLNRLVLERAQREMMLAEKRTQTDRTTKRSKTNGKADIKPQAKHSRLDQAQQAQTQLEADLDTLVPFTLKDVLRILNETVNPKPTTRNIIMSVAKEFGLKVRDLQSQSRKQSIVRARGLAMLLCRILLEMSLDEVGKQFGGRDHTTVLHACRKTQSQFEQDSELLLNLKSILNELGFEDQLDSFFDSNLDPNSPSKNTQPKQINKPTTV